MKTRTRRAASASTWAMLLLVSARAMAQAGPDGDPVGAQGYVNNVFHHASVDSVNLFNGQLTVPIALGPSYPVGPRLRFRAMLTYNSHVWEYGRPVQQWSGLFKPLSGDPAVGIGWTFTLGAIKGTGTNFLRYVGADGSEHGFFTDASLPAGYYETQDASQLRLRNRAGGGYEMWDGDGNSYVFGWPVFGYDDPFADFTRDFGRGRDGWYLTSVTDPFGNSYSVTYRTVPGPGPCWIYAPGQSCAVQQQMHCSGTNSWIPQSILLPTGTISVSVDVNKLIGAISFPGAGTWELHYQAEDYTRASGCDGTPTTVTLWELQSLELPTGDSYSFSYSSCSSVAGLLAGMTLPTGASIAYEYGNYSFHHSRVAQVRCPGQRPPPPTAWVWVSDNLCGGSSPTPNLPPGDDGCDPTDLAVYMTQSVGVVERTESIPSSVTPGGHIAVTAYKQYAFPFGERGSSGSSLGPQTLTVVTFPPDVDSQNANGSPVKVQAKASLFWAGQSDLSQPRIGGRTGADIEERVFDANPLPTSPGAIPIPSCGGSGADNQPFCSNRAVRVTKQTFDYDNPSTQTVNRRLLSETTYFGATALDGTCPGCRYHAVSHSLSSGKTWEGNGRHYNIESHAGNLGGDDRTITTTWTPSSWLTAPPFNGEVLPNLHNQRKDVLGSSTLDQYSYFNSLTGFLDGAITWDPSSGGRILARCATPDSAGNVSQEITATKAYSPPPAGGPWTSSPCGTILAGDVGTDGSTFGKTFAYQNGLPTKARWLKSSTPLSWYLADRDRDAATGRITRSRDTAGVTTDFAYDTLGRMTSVSPAGETPTFVCYPDARTTIAYRRTTSGACPLAGNESGVLTWQWYEYDGLGRLEREKRRMPDNSISKRFTIFDSRGHAFFASEWLASGTGETVAANVATACVFQSGTYPTKRPSGAPGTYQMCYDPFGRPQQMVGSKHSSLVTVDRADAATPYTTTKEATTVWCVNTTVTGGNCGPGGMNPVTTVKKDAFGRIKDVTEPSGDLTTYTYDVGDRLTSVGQSPQNRAFTYDAFGFLRSESTPEKGAVTYVAYGSLGNVRSKSEGGLTHDYTYDAAGRLLGESVGGVRHAMNCYDGASVSPTCPDGTTANFSGGVSPKGKRTRRVGTNPSYEPLSPTTPWAVNVTEDFTYSGVGGRLSARATAVAGGANRNTTEAWSYNTLGLMSLHGHPRFPNGPDSAALTETITYASGLPTSIALAGKRTDNSSIATATIAAAYGPSGTVSSYTASQSGSPPQTTTVTSDISLLPRPSRIATSLGGFDTGTYTYDGAGNILSMVKDASNADTLVYDSRSRLLSASYKVGGATTSQSTGYDRFGNIWQIGGVGARNFCSTGTCTNNRLPTSLASYDGRGNLTSYAGETLSWDGVNRQIKDVKAGVSWQYLYAGDDERVLRVPGASAGLAVTRREMARMMVQADGWPLSSGCAEGSRSFGDVHCADQDWQWIETFYDQGITSGCGGGNFCPDFPLTRAQLMVFLLRAEHGASYTPPPCTGIFADVSCTPTPAFAVDWIEQAYREGITSGCATGPLRFCPNNNVSGLELAVFLSKPALYPSYRGIPGGSSYTLRDDQNRVVTEFWDSSPGRDNVYLGNLLVASYVSHSNSGSPGWQFHSSDHLGSVRLTVAGSNGSVIESAKYWPYGERYGTPIVPAQKLSFASMERDGEANHFYDHARTHDFYLARFLSPDKVGGNPSNPQAWNKYAYTLGNPLKYLDPDGNVVVGFTGLWNKPTSGIHGIAGHFASHPELGPTRVFRWKEIRKAAAFVHEQVGANPNQPIVIYGHSRGAASSLSLARLLGKAGLTVDLVLTIDPVMIDPKLDHVLPRNVLAGRNYYETISSPLGGIYVTGDSVTADVKNVRVDGQPHSKIDDWLANARQELDAIVAEAKSQFEQRRAAERSCPTGDHDCVRVK